MARERISIRAVKDVLLVYGADLIMYSDNETTQTYAIDGATGAVTVSSDGTGADATWYGATSGTYMQWDASANSLLIPGTAGKVQMGALASAYGSATALTATYPAAMRIFADDGGAAIGSGTMTRAGEFRNLQTYTSGNREQEAAGVLGKLVSVAGTNRHNMCGVMGSYEVQTSLTVDGQAATTDTWCQAAIIGRVGGTSITVNTNGVLAGVAAMSNVATALAANNGIYPGFYVGRWTGAETWSHGVYVQNNSSDKAFQVGELSSTSQTGMHLTSTNPHIADFFADDNNTTLGNEVYTNVRARTMLFTDATGISLFSVRGQIKCADEVDLGPGVFAGVQGYFETMDDTDIQSGAKVWGIDASLESPSGGAVTVDSGGILGGLHAELTGAGSFTQSSGGILAGLYVDEQVTTGDWGYAIYVASGDKQYYGTNTISGSTATNSFDIEVTDTQTNSSGYSRGLYVNVASSGNKTSTGETNAVGIDLTPTGDSYIATPVSIYTAGCGSATISNLWGIYMYMDDIGGSATVTTKYGMSIGIDNGDNAATCGYMRFYEHSGSTMVDYVLDFPNAGHGAATYFLHVGCTGGMVEVGDITSGKSCTHGLRVSIGGTAKVIPLYED